MLAAWFRIKYPHIVVGALASSAPILQFRPLTPCWKFSAIVTNTFAVSGPNCDVAIRRSWTALTNLAKTVEGRRWLNSQFNLCKDSLIVNDTSASEMAGWLSEAWSYLAMIDYPYPTDFLSPVPAWPVKAACSNLNFTDPTKVTDKELMSGIFGAVSIFLNYTGKTPCFRFSNQGSTDLGVSGWDFQSCTEMVMPMCNNGTDMFPLSAWNLSDYNEGCVKKFGVSSRPDWVLSNYGGGGDSLRWATNIIFSNGVYDPWWGGGVSGRERWMSDSIVVILIKKGAHHLDLRGSDKRDTVWVTRARELEKATIRKWLKKTRRKSKLAKLGLQQW
jgi:lysosomal Pro-X carboxypeptidase